MVINFIYSKITIVQQKSVPHAMFSASSQLSRDGPPPLPEAEGNLIAAAGLNNARQSTIRLEV